MELRDFIVAPIITILVYLAAYRIRPYVTDEINRRYFLPALAVKIIGAISLGFIYQFYYDGGDTFKFHTYGSRVMWNILIESPVDGLNLLFFGGGSAHDKYILSVPIIRDASSFLVARISFFFDLFTFSSYSATTLFFASFGFVGTWALYLTFYKQFPHMHRSLAIAICFIPSVFFWGSGILKETIVVGCLGIATFLVYTVFIERRVSLFRLLLLILSLYFIFIVKKFVLQAYLPAALVWVMAANFGNIRSKMLKVLLVPGAFLFVIASSYFAVSKVGEGDDKYALDKIAQTAKITAYDIRYWTGRDAGSGYDLGELDGTFSSMLKLAPQAINVTLFRPYLTEVKNPLMLLSAIEGSVFLFLTIFILVKKGKQFFKSFFNPNVIFCFVFSISFSFAVGISTFNFGTLNRYKIPMLPFFALFLALVYNYEKRDKKVEVLDIIE